MDLNNIGEAEDRISELPDSILHHILSFLHDIKWVFRTTLLSKRWSHLWTSIPILDISHYSFSENDEFMDFVDRTLLLHDGPSIQKFSLDMEGQMRASRFYSWISKITKRNVKQVSLSWELETQFFIPRSLFTCESLITLELNAPFDGNTHLPKSFSFPNLKRLALSGIQFMDDRSWTEQHFSNCLFLEKLHLCYCTWFGVRNFCISIPALKLLEIDYNDIWDEDGLLECALKIDAPNLVSLTYRGNAAKEYVLSSFQTLEYAQVLLYGYDEPISEQKVGYYGAAVSKFFRALSHVRSLTIETPEVISIIDILPMFHNLDKLFLSVEETSDKSVFPLLKAAPNLTQLAFRNLIRDNEEEENIWAGFMTARCLFQHLQSVCFVYFSGKAREMRWLKLILKNAKALQKVSIVSHYSSANAITKEFLMSEFASLPKASDGCVLEFH